MKSFLHPSRLLLSAALVFILSGSAHAGWWDKDKDKDKDKKECATVPEINTAGLAGLGTLVIGGAFVMTSARRTRKSAE